MRQTRSWVNLFFPLICIEIYSKVEYTILGYLSYEKINMYYSKLLFTVYTYIFIYVYISLYVYKYLNMLCNHSVIIL